MPRRPSDLICAIAGVVLVVLVFLPWWEFDPGAVVYKPPPGMLGDLFLFAAPGVSPWDWLRGGALIWLATAVLAVSLVPAPRAGLRGAALARLRAAAAAAGLVSLIVAVVRVDDPPVAAYVPTPTAYAGLAVIVVIAASAAAGLRGPGRRPA